ncbi:MAG: MarR family transcriptional regulator [Caulobacteraceae bacterium]|nr:MarR family transcriptional regulator [Caulobacteraceae bacterium]
MNAPAKPLASASVSVLADRLRPVLLRLSRRLRREADQVGLSSLDAILLGVVGKHEGIGVSELADKERTSRPTMSSHVKRLEAAGLLAREAPSEADRRRVGLKLTPKGTKAIEALRRRRNDWLAGRLAALSPEQREAVAGALEALSQVAGLDQ